MKGRIGSWSLIGCCTSLLAACGGGPEPQPEKPPAPAESTAKPAMPSMSPEQMAKLLELGSPGPEHALLKMMEGDFKAEVTMWDSADATPQVSDGVVKNRLALGGRFLLGRFTGKVMELPFEGLSLMGFDRLQKQYTSLWADTMGTFMTPVATGSASADGRTLTLSMSWKNPFLGNARESQRQVYTILDDNSMRFEAFSKVEGASEFRSMVVNYTRHTDD